MTRFELVVTFDDAYRNNRIKQYFICLSKAPRVRHTNILSSVEFL